MIRFRCKKCGQRLGVPEMHAGKKGKCPKCKHIFVVPQACISDSKPSDELTLLDAPEEYKVAERLDRRGSTPDRTIEDVQRLEEQMKWKPVAERKLPWAIDIFLYPMSASGVIHLIVLWLGLIIIGLLSILFSLAGHYGSIITMIFYMLLVGYMFYYIGECVRDSATGGLRAPDISLQGIPDKEDLISQLFLVLGSVAVCFWMPSLYYGFVREANLIFWILLVSGGFFFPMALLASIMFNSASALNPVLLIGSIFSTFFQYCGLVVLFYGLGVLFVIIASILEQSRILAYITSIVYIYLLMVAGHLLGRFFWKYEEKLKWEV